MPKPSRQSHGAVQVSVVTPAFNEALNLPLLYQRLKKSLDKLRLRWEWIVVDDHSADETYRVMESIARKDRWVKVLRFARNSGSHLALACALGEARGQCAVGMAADLQDPPETIGELYGKWKEGARVVWAVRAERKGESRSTTFFARFYYFIVRYGIGMKQVPPTGADFFLLDRSVLNRLAKARIKNASLLLLISSFDFRQDFITYTKRERVHGKSGWSLQKKLKLFFDSITMFSKAPVYWMLGMGLTTALAGGYLAVKNAAGSGFFPLAVLLTAMGLLVLGAGISILKATSLASAGPLFLFEKRPGRSKK
ncbi:MAG TPA: glycosyltransferase family 2 protein [bacterium]|nr:glycosyltransferase family 2 protein [bacterium]